eukprot:COSAG05_NODE_1466_length_4804_cov_1.788523_5_plen_160_part_00
MLLPLWAIPTAYTLLGLLLPPLLNDDYSRGYGLYVDPTSSSRTGATTNGDDSSRSRDVAPPPLSCCFDLDRYGAPGEEATRAGYYAAVEAYSSEVFQFFAISFALSHAARYGWEYCLIHKHHPKPVSGTSLDMTGIRPTFCKIFFRTRTTESRCSYVLQ